jgi:hypothetical protein
MNQFQQRLQKRMQNKEFTAGYWEMNTELEFMWTMLTDQYTKKCSGAPCGRQALPQIQCELTTGTPKKK